MFLYYCARIVIVTFQEIDQYCRGKVSFVYVNAHLSTYSVLFLWRSKWRDIYELIKKYWFDNYHRNFLLGHSQDLISEMCNDQSDLKLRQLKILSSFLIKLQSLHKSFCGRRGSFRFPLIRQRSVRIEQYQRAKVKPNSKKEVYFKIT